jgi:bifunctional UDP-N-acetylglucosamine pyrophosphorylase / glucosamine-1-phosphate N-acetyltransferase
VDTVSLAVVILAVDKGAGLKSRHPKALHEIGGKPLLAHVIAAASRVVAPADIFVIVGDGAERIETALASTGVKFIYHAEQLAAGHALRSVSEAIAGYSDVLVLPGDVAMIQPETIAQLWELHRSRKASMTVLSAGQEEIREINSGVYAFRTNALLTHLNELPLADMAQALDSAGEPVVVQAANSMEVLGVNTIAELVALDASLRAKSAARLMAQGVTIYLPETCVIDADVEVGPDTVIEPYVQLLGKTRIGSDCLIRSSTVIENSTLADGILVRQSCIITDSTIETGAKIGPFAHLRPGSEIGEEVHIGNFVETKKARLGKGAKASHLTYLGDAEIGAGTNIGAGVITCNYDGVNKHMTKIGAGAFVGSDSTLVAPITVGDGAYIGAGSCITKEVPANALAVGRARQVTKEGWATAKRARQERACEP